MGLKLKRVATFIERFGAVKGLQLYLGLRRNNLSLIVLPGFTGPIALRPGTTDNAIFDQVFVRRDYGLPINFRPQVIVDAGGHIGLFTVFMKSRYPGARFVCIEPDRENYLQLQKNILGFNNVQTVQAAIWNNCGRVNMTERAGLGKSGLRAEEGGDESETEAITMEMLFEKFAFSKIDLLKMDIETAEKIVFSHGFSSWLKQVRMVIIELHDWLEPGCGRAFFEAVNQTFRNYRYSVWGENTVIENLDFGK